MYVIGHGELRELRKAGFYYDSNFGCFVVYKSAGLSLLVFQNKDKLIVEPVEPTKLEEIVKRYEAGSRVKYERNDRG